MGRIRTDDRIPEKQPGGEETGMLEIMPTAGPQGELVGSRRVPQPSGCDKHGQGRHGMRQPRKERSQRPRAQKGKDPIPAYGLRKTTEEREHWFAQPAQRRYGHHE